MRKGIERENYAELNNKSGNPGKAFIYRIFRRFFCSLNGFAADFCLILLH